MNKPTAARRQVNARAVAWARVCGIELRVNEIEYMAFCQKVKKTRRITQDVHVGPRFGLIPFFVVGFSALHVEKSTTLGTSAAINNCNFGY